MTDATAAVSGALLAQVLLSGILYIGISLHRAGQSKSGQWGSNPAYGNFGGELLLLLLSSVGVLTFTSQMSSFWLPLFPNTTFSGIPADYALIIVFCADIAAVTWIVRFTGGSIQSPFQPVYFFIPTVALLLREPSARVVVYSTLVSASFVWLLYRPVSNPYEKPSKSRVAYAFVAIACLFLAVLIGLLTRT